MGPTPPLEATIAVARHSATQRRWSFATSRAIPRAIAGSVLLAAALVLLTQTAIPAFGTDVTTNFLINLVAVVGIGIFIGNSGILSFGHVAFMGIAAYLSALLTMDAISKEALLPNLPGWLAETTLPLLVAMAIAVFAVGLAALIFGLPIARLPGYSAAIASLGVLVIVNVVLLGASDYTNGASTFYGAPLDTTLELSLAAAIGAIIAARLFRESRFGLQLRASREDETAAAAMGVDVQRLRLAAWVLGAMVIAVAGVLHAHYLGAFSPKEFYFVQTFTLLAMLIVGGSGSVTGAVAGAALISVLIEFLRRFENGVDLGLVNVPQIFGLTQIGLSVALIATMYFRRGGLFGPWELDELLARASRNFRRQAKAAD